MSTQRLLDLPGPLVPPDWLAARYEDAGLVVFDASIGSKRGAPRKIPGARAFDIDGALSDTRSPLPHTMPNADMFQREMRRLGLDDAHTVVVYDGAGIYSSARAWWMLRAMGFDRVAVLDGGLPHWVGSGYPVEDSDSAPAPAPGDFLARPKAGFFIDASQVLASLDDPASAVFDVRTQERFQGVVPEPRPGLRRGHMPGAFNLPFLELQDEGRMLPAEKLRRTFEGLAGERESFVFSCGSGVTACIPALAAELAGYVGAAVYDGSWSEWGLPSDFPVTGDRVTPNP